MAKDTPSMAKNKIRRSLLAIIDPPPVKGEIETLWAYFQSCCAYCGVAIPRTSRTGHIDHVISAALGGTNSIYNHVLSCARCNGDEKREEPWETFLGKKVTNPAIAAERHSAISAWLARATAPSISPAVRAQVNAIISEATNSFDTSVKAIRALRKGGT